MDYSKTVHLPKTTFPMKADLPKREPAMIDFWRQKGIYAKIAARRRGSKKYILHDGPPYANGHLHMGHALNKILKDFVVKYKTLTGHFSPYVPGWDCHGLPIEHQLMKELKKDKHSVDHLEFRKKAADFAKNFVDIQKREFERLGVLGDWENPYLTLTPHYEEFILRSFRELCEKGYVYRGLKPVQWCPHCETALAEAEVEYEEKESPAIYVKFKVMAPATVPSSFPQGLYIIVWTTTPWTLPANVGLMLGNSIDYAFVRIKQSNETWVVAKKLVRTLLEEKLKATDYEIVKEAKGRDLPDFFYDRIFPKTGDMASSESFLSDEVSEEEGTGIVHIAPGHGAVDYVEGHLNNELPILSPVDDRGKFSAAVNHPDLQGLFVMKAGNEKIIELLKEKGLRVFSEKIRHSYPHCWRCKNPVIFRATHQWFLNVEHEDLRKRMLAEIDNVQWVPDYGKNRIRGMIEQRPDWCLSRQRLWGTPIPVFYCEKCREPLLDPQAINMVEEAVGLDGSDVWFKESPEYFLKNSQPFKCAKCGHDKFVKENDILDVWFDSGVSHEAVLKGETKTVSGTAWKEDLAWPADMYLEGSDQHRGWFQTSLIPSVALHGRAPYKTVLTHGFIVDGEGKKMSKSLGNVIAPEDILKDYGADILRLWVAASDYREDIRLSKDILKGVAENYKKIRNTFRYLIGNLSGFDFEKESLPYNELLEVDRWALLRLSETVESARRAYEDFEFHKAVVALVEFCAIDCSSFYFDILKDRLYTFRKDSRERRSALTVLHHILSTLARTFSPLLSFTCEEVWQAGLENGYWREESVFLADLPQANQEWRDKGLKERWEKLIKIKEKTNLSLETARQAGKIGSSLEARVIFSGGEGGEKEILESMQKELAMVLIVSQVELNGGTGPLAIQVEKARGQKCARCWRYEESVGGHGEHPTICGRCVSMIA